MHNATDAIDAAIIDLDSTKLDKALDAMAVSWPIPTNSKHTKCPGCNKAYTPVRSEDI